jgi:hypothetical protein
MDSEPAPREASLRSEFASEYPGLQAGVWLNARELAKRLVDRSHARRRQGLYTRTFDPRHFDFRGGEPPRPSDQQGARTRATDA